MKPERGCQHKSGEVPVSAVSRKNLTERPKTTKIDSGLSGETGENPVRARRREALILCKPYLRPPQRGEMSLEPCSEKAVCTCAESKYPDGQNTLSDDPVNGTDDSSVTFF